MPSAHSPMLAIFLSAVLPGLGQFYNRQWKKGAGFLVATLVMDAAFGVTSETIAVFQSAFLGMPGTNVNIGGFVLRMLPLAAIATWSMTDAARTAKRRLN
jgi:TM2 domain.